MDNLQGQSGGHAAAGGVLGQRVEMPMEYTPSILQAVPRAVHASVLHVGDRIYPRKGVDVWQAYEISCLYGEGIPAVGLLKMSYAAGSKVLVESKSLKLYLNSFNNHCYSECRTAEDALSEMRWTVEADLSALLGVEVRAQPHQVKGGESDFSDYLVLEEDERFVSGGRLQEGVYGEKLDSGEYEFRVATHLLRSHCPVTGQPDWGTAYVRYRCEKPLEVKGFLEYVLSMRNEHHFHEEICDTLYEHLLGEYGPGELMVACAYTRRGGIEINPIRYTDESFVPWRLVDLLTWSAGTPRQ